MELQSQVQLPKKQGEGSNKKDKANITVSNVFLNFIVENIGPTSYGARNWFIVIVISILFLGLFPTAPFGVLMAGKAVAIGALVAVIVDVWVGLRDDYTEFEEARKITSFFDYLSISIKDWFQQPRNQIQFFFGATLLIVSLSIFLLCGIPGVETVATIEMPDVQTVIEGIHSFVSFFSDAFLSVFNEALSKTTAPIVTSIFLSTAALTAYDVVCRAVKWVWPIEGEKAALNRVEAKIESKIMRPQVQQVVEVKTPSFNPTFHPGYDNSDPEHDNTDPAFASEAKQSS